jgi:hypothetical protein
VLFTIWQGGQLAIPVRTTLAKVKTILGADYTLAMKSAVPCQALCYFVVCIPLASIRNGSCLLDSYFLDRSFQMHFVGKLDGLIKIEAQWTKKRSKKRDRNFSGF